MAEGNKSILKSTGKKNKNDKPKSTSFLQCSTSSIGTVNSGRLSLMGNIRAQKLPLGREKDESSEIENYYLEYSKYLLRKAQNQVLAVNKAKKEENVKRCLVSVKLEYEKLLDRYVKLHKEVEYFEKYCKILIALNNKIEEGNKVLKVVRETEFDSLMESLSNRFSSSINQLQIVDFDKKVIDKAFTEKVWGPGSEIETCLKKIDSFLKKDKAEVAKIAEELSEIRKLHSENIIMTERFNSIFKIVSKEIVEANYKLFTGVVKKAFDEREKTKDEKFTDFLECDLEFFYPDMKPANNQQVRLSFPNLEGSYLVLPNSSSTPQQSNKN